MSLKSRTTLKSYFETNDKPNQSNYEDLIDSIPNFVDDNPTYGFDWKEAWDNSVRYVKYDSVYYSVTGASYVCIKAHDAYFVPTNTTYWSKISEKGADGAKVTSVAFSGNDIVFTLDDSSTVTLTNAKIDLKGDTGAQVVSAAFVGDDMVFTLDDASTATLTGALTSLKGNQGDPGDAATIAVGTVTTVANGVPASVTNSGTSAAAVFDFEIPKGLDGEGSGDISGSGTANELAYFTAEKTIDNLPVATYPSLTELSYVKGVTSGIQSQLNGKQATGSYEVTTNKETSALDTSTTKYPCNNVVKTAVDAKMSNPMSATGDIIYGGASGVATRLAKGDDDKVLMLKSGLPSWETPASGGADIIEVQMFS